MTPLLESALPIAAAPMSGGPTTVPLAAATARAGAFPFLAAGYRTAEEMAAQIDELTAALEGTGQPFGVNLFVFANQAVDEAAFRAYADRLRPEAEALGVTLDPRPVADDDQWPAKLDALRRRPVPVVSLTFGLLPAADVAALRSAGTRVLATVTTAAEARAARDTGVDGLVIQGPAAGGHSATLDPTRTIELVPTADRVRDVVAATGLPVIATGGVDGPEAVKELLAAGAESVAVGTLLLRTDESGASATHRDALADPRYTRTVMTRAFTGRPARGLRNGFIDRHEAEAPASFPAVHHLTRPLRQAAARANDPERLHLWAGTGYRAARTGPAADVITGLARGL